MKAEYLGYKTTLNGVSSKSVVAFKPNK